MRRPMRHATEVKLRVAIETLAVEPVKQRRGGRAIEAAIVKTEPYAGHSGPSAPSLPFGQRIPCDKALNNAGEKYESQERSPLPPRASVTARHPPRNPARISPRETHP